jgi:alpha-glutamyl/putrescinyl thymine pyrophosphorylase clade 1
MLTNKYSVLLPWANMTVPRRRAQSSLKKDEGFSKSGSRDGKADEQLKLGLLTAKHGGFAKELPAAAPAQPLSDIWIRLSPAVPTAAYESYWRFAVERQLVFFRRLSNAPPPWTNDPIIDRYKFTNAYRASDRVSQFLIRNVIYTSGFDARDTFFRILLFKLFNKVETWRLLENHVGVISWRDYSFKSYDRVLTGAMARGTRIYSAAYIMPSGRLESGIEPTKHRFHLRLLENMMRDDVPTRLGAAGSMLEGFSLLRSYNSIGDFLAYQFVTDVNYSELTHFSESEFVQPGPGALDGIRKCFKSLGGLSAAEIIRFVADRQEAEFDRLGLAFPSLWGRRLQLIDCQNLFCEVGKYSRVRHPEIAGVSERKRIKQHFSPAPERLAVWYPPKWGLNERIACDPTGTEWMSSENGVDLQ